MSRKYKGTLEKYECFLEAKIPVKTEFKIL